MKEIYNELIKEMHKIPVIDTHERLLPFEDLSDSNTDVLKEYLTHYMSSDLISAGMKLDDMKKVIDTTLPILQRWKIVENYREYCRYTGYGQSLDIAVKDSNQKMNS